MPCDPLHYYLRKLTSRQLDKTLGAGPTTPHQGWPGHGSPTYAAKQTLQPVPSDKTSLGTTTTAFCCKCTALPKRVKGTYSMRILCYIAKSAISIIHTLYTKKGTFNALCKFSHGKTSEKSLRGGIIKLPFKMLLDPVSKNNRDINFRTFLQEQNDFKNKNFFIFIVRRLLWYQT